METEEKPLEEVEGLQIIQQMISQAKQHYSDDSFMFLLWGWLVFIASLSHYILANEGFENAQLVWLLMIVGGIASALYGRKKRKQAQVKTYIDEFSKHVLVAFMVSLFIVLFFMQHLLLNCYPMVMMVYGIWLYVSGGTLRFKPLMIGGIINWALAVLAFYAEFNTQLLLLALAVLCGYIIPGYMLRNRYKKQQQA